MDELPLYWTDPDLMECTATVTSAEPLPGGWKLGLDRQLFYPGGGGQRPDRGLIDGCPVDGINKAGGEIQIDITGDKKFAPGDKVHCELDAGFRTDSRQQHSGQHLISSALSLQGLDTVSVHLGADYTAIEVSGNSNIDKTERIIAKVLETCDLWINEAREIKSLYLKPEELQDLELRRSLKSDKKRKNDGGAPIRIIEIEGIDRVGCGGVHLMNTSSIGPILFAGSEKMRGHTRLHWLVGDRALLQARFLNSQGQKIQKLLSAGPGEAVGRITSILEENRKMQQSLKNAEKEIGRLQAAVWIAAENPENTITESISGGKDRMEGALECILDSSIRIAFLISGNDDSKGFSWLLVHRGIENSGFDEFKAEFLQELNGSGGGKPPVWRGRLDGDSREILSAFRKRLASQTIR